MKRGRLGILLVVSIVIALLAWMAYPLLMQVVTQPPQPPQARISLTQVRTSAGSLCPDVRVQVYVLNFTLENSGNADGNATVELLIDGTVVEEAENVLFFRELDEYPVPAGENKTYREQITVFDCLPHKLTARLVEPSGDGPGDGPGDCAGDGPPADVYARPSPSISTEPLDLMPNQVAGFDLVRSPATSSTADLRSAQGNYDGAGQFQLPRVPGVTVQITITKWASTDLATNWLNQFSSSQEARADSFACGHADEQHWYTATVPGEASSFAWRKGVWTFLVIAPDPALVNQVAGELPF